MKKLLLVFGTRPEAIKMAPLVNEFKKYPSKFHVQVCVTAQHREMLDQVLRLFEITPDYDLNIMQSGQDLYDITSRVLLGMRQVLEEVKPDVVFVHGDTATSTAAALAAFYKQIPVAHIEAGLRTHNIYSPWPEEINRQLTSRLATFHFAPTPLAQNNLLQENILPQKITVTGNTVIDALHWVTEKIKTDKSLQKSINKTLINNGLSNEIINSKFILITGHRRENFGEGFINICKAIKELSEKYPTVNFLYPMHLNPNVRKPIQEVFGNLTLTQNSKLKTQNCFFIEPLDYLPFVYLMSKSYLLLTDSGGIQEEAPGLGKPVLVMRDTTERPEAVEAGTVKLVGTETKRIIEEISELIENKSVYLSMSNAQNPYGNGNASKEIVQFFKYRNMDF